MPRSKSTVLRRNRVIELALKEFSRAYHCLEVGERLEKKKLVIGSASLKDNTPPPHIPLSPQLDQ